MKDKLSIAFLAISIVLSAYFFWLIEAAKDVAPVTPIKQSECALRGGVEITISNNNGVIGTYCEVAK